LTQKKQLSETISCAPLKINNERIKGQGLLLISHICMHHQKARKTRLVKFVRLPGMVEAGVLRYAYPFVHSHAPFW
jgi:hypothetical protein